MLNPVQKKRYQKRFSAVESSFRIEGMDPSRDAIYRHAKQQVLDGKMTPKEALDYVIEHSASCQTKIAVSA